MKKFNEWLALKITDIVSTMWCAYAFALLALVSLPAAIQGGMPTLITWIAQTFLQLVLLSVIMVGQKVQTGHHERHHADHGEVMAELKKIHGRIDQVEDSVPRELADIL